MPVLDFYHNEVLFKALSLNLMNYEKEIHSKLKRYFDKLTLLLLYNFSLNFNKKLLFIMVRQTKIKYAKIQFPFYAYVSLTERIFENFDTRLPHIWSLKRKHS